MGETDVNLLQARNVFLLYLKVNPLKCSHQERSHLLLPVSWEGRSLILMLQLANRNGLNHIKHIFIQVLQYFYISSQVFKNNIGPPTPRE